MSRRGVVERISRGVYRLVQFPPVPHGQELEATLWPASGRWTPWTLADELDLPTRTLNAVAGAITAWVSAIAAA